MSDAKQIEQLTEEERAFLALLPSHLGKRRMARLAQLVYYLEEEAERLKKALAIANGLLRMHATQPLHPAVLAYLSAQPAAPCACGHREEPLAELARRAWNK